jgi:hypothetical protein
MRLAILLAVLALLPACAFRSDFPEGQFDLAFGDAYVTQCAEFTKDESGEVVCAETTKETRGGNAGEDVTSVFGKLVEVVGGLLPRGISPE